MTVPKVLVADDDPFVLELVRAALLKADMIALLAEDGDKALEIWRNNAVNLIILDIIMPGTDGLEACRYIRRISEVPILMLTAKGGEDDILSGFEAGADDYIVKPFKPKELIARVRAILHRFERPPIPPGSQLAYRDLVLNIATGRVMVGSDNIPTTPLEFHLLRYMMQRVGTAVSKEDLFRNVWGYAMPAGGMNLIEVAVRRLREKIERDPSHPRFIQTARGIGYRFGD